MLVLTRRIGQDIIIGNPEHPLGVIRVADIYGDKVRLAFDFPKSTLIYRREVVKEKVAAAGHEDK